MFQTRLGVLWLVVCFSGFSFLYGPALFAASAEFAETVEEAQIKPIKKEKKWEFGVGVGAQYLPDYRGSDRYRSFLAPFPIVRYTGKFFKADAKGIRGELSVSDRVQVNISADSSLVIGADDNNLREGMSDLLPAFEIGPSVNIKLTNNAGQDKADQNNDGHNRNNNKGVWSLALPIRVVAATNFKKAEYVGLVFHPHVIYSKKNWIGGWDGTVNAGVLFADSDLHDYYYGVASYEETPRRTRFDASGGYSGAAFKLSLRKRTGPLWMSGAVRYNNLSGAKFVASPLLETKHSYGLSFALGWFFR